mmetsp:Transcript_12956/g.24776  ORF Transcript_12956/g.24776 Transcript_12956/m.24776 type:complete len:303 (+) Transcript_12956:367-1275(+)
MQQRVALLRRCQAAALPFTSRKALHESRDHLAPNEPDRFAGVCLSLPVGLCTPYVDRPRPVLRVKKLRCLLAVPGVDSAEEARKELALRAPRVVRGVQELVRLVRERILQEGLVQVMDLFVLVAPALLHAAVDRVQPLGAALQRVRAVRFRLAAATETAAWASHDLHSHILVPPRVVPQQLHGRGDAVDHGHCAHILHVRFLDCTARAADPLELIRQLGQAQRVHGRAQGRFHDAAACPEEACRARRFAQRVVEDAVIREGGKLHLARAQHPRQLARRDDRVDVPLIARAKRLVLLGSARHH